MKLMKLMKGKREGFTIIEAVVAMVILSIVLTTLARLMYITAQTSIRSKDFMKRDGYALEMMNRLDALPYASIPASYCETVGTVRDQYQRCATVTTVGQRRNVVIVTTPLQRNTAAVTYQFSRSAPPLANPLCTTC